MWKKLFDNNLKLFIDNREYKCGITRKKIRRLEPHILFDRNMVLSIEGTEKLIKLLKHHTNSKNDLTGKDNIDIETITLMRSSDCFCDKTGINPATGEPYKGIEIRNETDHEGRIHKVCVEDFISTLNEIINYVDVTTHKYVDDSMAITSIRREGIEALCFDDFYDIEDLIDLLETDVEKHRELNSPEVEQKCYFCKEKIGIDEDCISVALKTCHKSCYKKARENINQDWVKKMATLSNI